MAWRDDLRPASFRGVEFHVVDSTLSAGRRVARHEFPQRDIPYMEDMGRRAREFKVEALIIGADYMSARDRLIEAIEEEGAGQLVHPYHGTVQVNVLGEVSISESTREGGMAKFAIVFVEAGKQETPTTSLNTDSLLLDQYLDTEDAIADDFAGLFTVDGQADFVVQDALDSVNQLLAYPSMALGTLDLIRADPLSALQSLLPENLLGSLSNPLALAKGILSLVRNASSVMSLFDFGSDAVAVNIATPSRQQQNTNRSALTAMVQQAATARRVVDLGQSVPATITEARTARAEIVSRADAVLLQETVGQHSADAFVQLRTQAIQHFSRQTADLPKLVSVTHQEVLPAIVVAHDFYGDSWLGTGKDADLVARNAVRHPGFVPAGQPLQMISE